MITLRLEQSYYNNYYYCYPNVATQGSLRIEITNSQSGHFKNEIHFFGGDFAKKKQSLLYIPFSNILIWLQERFGPSCSNVGQHYPPDNCYPADNIIDFPNTYTLDHERYPSFEQLRPDKQWKSLYTYGQVWLTTEFLLMASALRIKVPHLPLP